MQSFFEFQDEYLDGIGELFDRFESEIDDITPLLDRLEGRWRAFYHKLFSRQGAMDERGGWVELTEKYQQWKIAKVGFAYPMGRFEGDMMKGFQGGSGYYSNRVGNKLNIGLLEGSEAGEHAEYFDGGSGKKHVNPRSLKLTYGEIKRWDEEIKEFISDAFVHASGPVSVTNVGKSGHRMSGYRNTEKGRRYGFIKAADVSSRFQRA